MKKLSTLLLVCTAIALGAPFIVSLNAVSTTVVISEFRVRGPNGGNDEFIELYNVSAAPVDISDWKVKGSNNTGFVSVRTTIPSGVILNPGCFYLVTNTNPSFGYSGSVTGNRTYTTGITDDGGLALTLPNDTIVDAVGMHNGSAFKEGAPLASLGSSNQNRSYEREPGGTAGHHTDTDNNSTDFQLISPSSPQNAASPCSGGTPVESPSIIYLPHDIQGDATTSPFTGQTVTVEGVITARKSNGIFLQTAAGLEDANAATSEGLFVFTSVAPPATAIAGTLVRVTGTVAEFSGDGRGQTQTEITNPSIDTLDAAAIPPAVPLTLDELSPQAGFDQLERFEGMQVFLSSLTTVSGTAGFFTSGEASGSMTSNGVFYAVLTGTPRPTREIGLDLPVAPAFANACEAGPPCAIPVFDFNPERLRVDSDELGAPRLDVTSGVVIQNLTAVVDSGYITWNLLPVPGASPAPVVGPNALQLGVAAAPAGQFTVASFNMQRFFDAEDDLGVGDLKLTVTNYANREAKVSLVIRTALNMPDVLAVQEVEKLAVLEDVAARVNSDAGLPGEYTAYLEEGNDPGGIDVGFLVRSRVHVSNVTQEGKTATFFDPVDGSEDLLNDRPPLVLRATIDGPPTMLDANVIVVANHLRSLNDVERLPRVRAKRQQQAEFLANLLDQLQEEGPVISVGDYNAFEDSDGLVDIMGTVLGTPTPPDQIVLASPDLVEPDFVDAAPGAYSYVFEGNAQALDHVLISTAAQDLFLGVQHAHINADFPEVYRNDPSRVERLSDHDPAVAYFMFPPDVTPPVIGTVTPSAATLWPANHRMVPVTIGVTATDDGTLAECVVSNVSSNEPVDGTGDGATTPDWTVDSPLGVTLRAERDGNGPGRTYTITISCGDAAGNMSVAATTVSVPHSQAAGKQ